jgi:hypothetical protein
MLVLDAMPEEQRFNLTMPLFKYIQQYLKNENRNRKYSQLPQQKQQYSKQGGYDTNRYGNRPQIVENAAAATTEMAAVVSANEI